MIMYCFERKNYLISIISFLVIINFTTVSPTCNSVTEFTCNNGNCIPLNKINNTVNDCGDNSEEGIYFVCPKANQFKCTLGNCVPISYVGDGAIDCDPSPNKVDRSDEAKIVGTNCSNTGCNICNGGCCGCTEFIPESECNGTKQCDCKSGRYSNPIGTACIIRKMYDPCTTDPDCSDAIVNTVCSSGMCDCRLGYYVSEDNTTCIKRKLYDSCSVHVDCSAAMRNSNCTDLQCVCSNGYKPNSDNTTCNRRKIGDSCSLQTDCYPAVTHSLCDTDATCQCKFDYKVNSDRTKCLTLKINDPCTNDTQCAFGVTYSNCTNGQCMCNSGFHPDLNTLSYCNARRIGDNTCVLDTDCSDSVANSSCVSGTCLCLLGYKATTSLYQCLPYQIGDTCPANQQCYASFNPNTCTNWNQCENTTDCSTSVQHSYCGVNTTCECDPGYYVLPSNTTCQARQLGDHCLLHSDCCSILGDVVCVNQSCQCDIGYTFDNNTGKCRKRLLNESCTANSDCGTIANSQCTNQTCSCVLGYQANVNLTGCDSLNIGDSCSSSEACAAAVVNSFCHIETGASTGTCKCNQGLLPNPGNTNCFDFQLNISTCAVTSECLSKTAHSLCIAGVCVCETNYVADENATSCVVPTIGQLACDTSAYCRSKISNSHCENSVCTCDTGYRPSAGSTTCTVFSLGDSGCRNNQDCLTSVANSYCSNDTTCVCAGGFHGSVDGTQCLPVDPDTGSSTSCSSLMCIPWAIALICLLIGGIVLIVSLVICGPITGKIVFCAPKNKRKVVPTDIYRSSFKPPPDALWAITAPGIKVMYKDKDMAEPHELEFDNDSGMYDDPSDGLVFPNEGLLDSDDNNPPPYQEIDTAIPGNSPPEVQHNMTRPTNENKI